MSDRNTFERQRVPHETEEPHLDWDAEEQETTVFDKEPAGFEVLRRTTEFPAESDAFPTSTGPVLRPPLETVRLVVEQPNTWPSQTSLPAAHPIPSPPPPPVQQATRSWRMELNILAGLLLLLVGVAVYAASTRKGTLDVRVMPANASVTIDGVPVSGRSPFLIEKRSGVHRLAASSPGYETVSQRVQINAKQPGRLDITLPPSADTGFELSSTPAGALIWVDGKPLMLGSDGRQAMTNVRALRIAPGPHVVEVVGGPSYQPWKETFVQEPGRIVFLHATLVPAPSTRVEKGHAAARPSRPSPASSAGDSAAATEAPGATGPTRRLQSDDPFDDTTWRKPPKQTRPRSRSTSDVDIFETYGK